MEGEFEDEFHFEYQRNNKGSGQKNLRCFPKCNETGHTNSGFCGHPITCRVQGLPHSLTALRPTPSPHDGNLIVAFGEFCLFESESKYRKGERYSSESVLKEVRSREQPLLPLIEGDCSLEDEESLKVVFNSQLVGYHYGWVSNKHTCESDHVFRAHFFLLSSPETNDTGKSLTYMDHLDSTPFKLFSRRRTRPGKPPSKEEIEEREGKRRGIKRIRRPSSHSTHSFKVLALSPPTPPSLPSSNTSSSTSVSSTSLTTCTTRPIPLHVSNSSIEQVNKCESCGTKLDSGVTCSQCSTNQNTVKSEEGKGMYRTFVDSVSRMISFNSNILLGTQERKDDAGWERKTLLARRVSEMNAEMMENRVLDRLCLFIFQFGGSKFNPGSSRVADTSSTASTTAAGTGSSTGGGLENATYQEPSWNVSSFEKPSAPLLAGQGFASMYDLFDDSDLDLLLDQTTSGGVATEQQHVTEENDIDVSGCRSLRMMLVENGVSDVDAVIEALHILNEHVFAEALRMDVFSKMMKRWSSPEGLRKLKGQVQMEQSQNFDWSPRRELETFKPNESLERSIFAELRQCFRDVVHRALDSAGFSAQMFQESMELAAKHHIISPDPFYPPDVRGASFIHLQLNGDLKKFQEQDYGSLSNAFRDETQHKVYAKHLTIIRRSIFRKMICNRIIQEQREKHTTEAEGDKPVHPDWDINGTWLTVTEDQEIRLHAMSQLWASLNGMVMGSFFGKLFNSLFSKVDFRLTQRTFRLKGQKFLFAHPCFTANIGGPPLPFRIPFPVPIGTMAPILIERSLTAWYSRGANGTPIVNLLIAGPAMHASASAIRDFAASHGQSRQDHRSQKRYEMPSFEEIQAFLALRRPLTESSGKEPMAELRVHKAFHVASVKKNLLKLHHTFYIFPCASMAPALDDFAGHENMASNPNCLRLLHMEIKYIRAYTDVGEDEAILELCQQHIQ